MAVCAREIGEVTFIQFLVDAIGFDKSDDARKQTSERLIARKDLIEALEQGRSRLGLRLKLSHAQRDELAADASGDKLDAALCLMQAAWAWDQPAYGLPADMDPLEGWILTSCAEA